MLMFILLVAFTLPLEGEQELTWKHPEVETYTENRLLIKCYGAQLQPSDTINEVLVQLNHTGETKVLSHCLRNVDTCVNHREGIKVYSSANFSNFQIIVSSVTPAHIGNYLCAYYDKQSLLLGTECTYVDVLVTPQFLRIAIGEDFAPVNGSLIELRAGKTATLTCSTISRPAVNISWDYPKWLKLEQYQNQNIINTYLTKTSSRVTFTMTSTLQGRILRCMTFSTEGNRFAHNKSLGVNVLAPLDDLSVSLYLLREEVMNDGNKLNVKVNEDYVLVCSMLSRTLSKILPYWNIPSDMTGVKESFSSKTYPYHDGFSVNIVQLVFKGTWKLHNSSIECTAKQDTNFYSIKLSIQVEGYFQRRLILLASVAVAVLILLIAISYLLIYSRKRRFSVSEIHHSYTKNEGNAKTASFRRSLPPVPGSSFNLSKRKQSSMAFSNSYISIYDALNEAGEKKKVDIIPYRDICFIMELFTSGLTKRWLGSFVSGEGTNEALITSVDETSDPKVQLLWQSYVALLLRLPEHRNVISIYGMSYHKDFIYVLQDYIETITLRYHLKTEHLDKIENQTTLTSLLNYARDVLDGMLFLNLQECCHPGLSAQKVLVNSMGTCKLYDFCTASNATDVLENYNLDKDHDVLKSLPPESILLGEYTPASDVWSVGVTFWEILSCGEVPFPNVTLNEFEKIIRKKQRLERPEGVPYEIFEIIQSCWSQRSARRPSLTVVKDKLEAFTSSIHNLVKEDYHVSSNASEEAEDDNNFENTGTEAHTDHVYQRTISKK